MCRSPQGSADLKFVADGPTERTKLSQNAGGVRCKALRDRPARTVVRPQKGRLRQTFVTRASPEGDRYARDFNEPRA